MGLNYFIFNGESSLDHGMYIGGQATFNAPQRDVSKISIPGRNGDLIRDNGRFLNIQVTYNIVVMKEFRQRTAEIREWLKSVTSYSRIEDTYNPDFYRMGVVTGGIDFETSAFNATGKAQITFDCKPERWLKSGEDALVYDDFSENRYITNLNGFDSKPLIRVFGNGTCRFSIWNYSVKIDNVSEYVDIDCEIMDCYKGAINMNNNVTLNSYGFPTIKKGKSRVTISGNTTGLEITPRWWTV